MAKTIDNVKYVRLICYECKKHGLTSVKYLTKEQYNYQMNNPNKTWRCPDCGTYDCSFDDEYWENNVGIN